MLTYQELEARYGEIVAQYFLKEIEKAAKIAANSNNVDYEARIAHAQRMQDLHRKG